VIGFISKTAYLYIYNRQNFSGDWPAFGDPWPPLALQSEGARNAPALYVWIARDNLLASDSYVLIYTTQWSCNGRSMICVYVFVRAKTAEPIIRRLAWTEETISYIGHIWAPAGEYDWTLVLGDDVGCRYHLLFHPYTFCCPSYLSFSRFKVDHQCHKPGANGHHLECPTYRDSTVAQS